MIQAPKLLDQVREAIRVRHYSIRTEKSYVSWVRQYILFHDKKHPRDMGEREVSSFLSYLASQRNAAASTQNQALSAILFLYREVLKIELGDLWTHYRTIPDLFEHSTGSDLLFQQLALP